MTLKVDTITNVAGTGAPNATDGVTVGGAALSSVNQMEYVSSAEPPSNPANGSVWWSTGDAQMFLYVNDAWYEIASSPPPPAFFGTRGVFAGGFDSSNQRTNRVDYVTIASPGNATDFGDLSVASAYGSGASNGTRGCFAIGYDGSNDVNTIDYFTIANTGNATDFGDLTLARWGAAGNHGLTRGLFAGGNQGPSGYSKTNTIDYITIATTGNATDFGNLTRSTEFAGTASDATRALWAGGNSSNIIDYVTVDTTGNATDFGDLTNTTSDSAGIGNGTYAIFKYGVNYTDDLNVVAIQTPANATVFGTLTSNRLAPAGNVGDGTYGLFAGGRLENTGTPTNNIDVITVATSGSATDFGNLTQARRSFNGFQGT